MKKLIMMMLLLSAQSMVSGQQQTKKTLIPFVDFEQKLEAQAGEAQILDARSYEEYQQNHVKGAVNVVDEEQLSAVVKQLNKEKPVFVYSIGNGRSGKLAVLLQELGFGEVYEFPGGLSKWIGKGKPVESTVDEGLSLADFQEQVKADQLVLVDVGSRYCGGCQKLKPVVAEVVSEHSDVFKLVDIEAYDNKQLIKELAVEALPTLILYKENEVVWKKTGLSSKEEIVNQLNKHKL
ncbi:sulfurtransferase [Olivibacter sp. SDN3]|uniref:thioredoxin domain-containing protein n=1 Tax=Olivibacter sp. SDN3 TaxID=2764720 RepID=UPI00165119C5|nr:thioredoxin domain-containing protein [Olivibacter sp. SDN3]QNL50407.1 sulfurtransferase [Olivibacter sp. SDN3]